MTAGLLAALAAFGLFLAGHVLLFQVCDIQKRFNAMALTWLVLVAGYAVLEAVFRRVLPAALVTPGIGPWLNGAVVYLLLFLIYCCFYFTDHSLSVAYMLELEQRPGKTMTLGELKARFPHDVMLRERLADLIVHHYVVPDGECYRLAPKGKLFAGTLGGIKRMLRLEPGG